MYCVVGLTQEEREEQRRQEEEARLKKEAEEKAERERKEAEEAQENKRRQEEWVSASLVIHLWGIDLFILLMINAELKNISLM